MKKVGVFEAKTRFSALVGDAVRGETTVITRNGKPVAQIGPVQSAQGERATLAAERLRTLRARLAASGKLRGLDVRALIDEGRR